MKLTVKNIFRDKTDHVTVYEPGTILDVKDKERAADLVKRGLCAEYTGKKAAAVTLGEEAPAEETPETPAEETPETPAEETPETPAEETPETPAEETPETPAEVEKPKGKKK